MKDWVEWFARNRVAANLLMAAIVILGLFSTLGLRMELFPEFSLEMISIRVPYPGAAPEEVEEGVCIPIEEEVHGLLGVKHIRSTAAEGFGTVTVEVESGFDVRTLMGDVKTRVDAIDTFPELAEQPVIEELLIREKVINIAIYGDVGEATLKHFGERVRDDLSALDGITQVELVSVRPYEVSIEVSEPELRRYGIDFDFVANAVRGSSLDLSGGSLKTEGGEILLRTSGKAYRGEEFERIVLITQPDGSRVLLGDVAEVRDGFAETDQSARFNGSPSVMVSVYRIGDQNALDVAEKVHAYIADTAPSLPAGVSIEAWQDYAVFLSGRLETLTRNGLQGLILVFLVLALFLKFRLAFWVTLGIPVSFLGTLWVMPALGMSINLLSLFAFILVLGIVVDDAIVVGESIYKEQSDGTPGLEGAILGAKRVAVPVTFAVLTSVAAFMPMLGLPGIMGKFFRVMPLVVIPALLFSLMESKLILPAHLAHESKWITRLSARRPFCWWVGVQRRFARGLEFVAERLYHPLLTLGLRHRYATAAIAIALMCLTVGVIRGGFVKFVFFPNIEGDVVAAHIEMPLGTAAKTTALAVKQVEAAAAQLARELEDEGEPDVIRNYLASVGEQPYRAEKQMGGPALSPFNGAHYGEVTIELAPDEVREIRSADLAERWRDLCGEIPGAVDLVFDSGIMDAGDPINVQLSATNMETLRRATAELKELLRGTEGVYEITDSFRGGKQEVALDIRPGAEALGLNRGDLARQVRQGFYGEEAQRIQRGRDEVKVMVRYPQADRLSLYGLDQMRVRTGEGAGIPFPAVATATMSQGFAAIQRTDRRRTVNVTAQVDTAVTTGGDVLKALAAKPLPALLAEHPGLAYTFEGQDRDMQDSVTALLQQFALALLAIFALMAVPFRSYLQPLIVMTAIPFGIVGAVAGHVLMGMELSLLSLCGMAALAGVVVNDSLVLVDYVNEQHRGGKSIVEAARSAGLARFRPIVLTSLTTFAGLTPLILEPSVQAQFLIPMGVTLAFGVLFSTFISLVLVPAGYLILDDLRRLPRRVWYFGVEGGPRSPEPSSGTPAALS